MLRNKPHAIPPSYAAGTANGTGPSEAEDESECWDIESAFRQANHSPTAKQYCPRRFGMRYRRQILSLLRR
jgi:hypothetical protein